MKQEMNGAFIAHSGDINFVAALMSQGIPLDRERPCKLIHREGGAYTSFRYMNASDDGTQPVAPLIEHWNNTKHLADVHGFAQVCQFIKARPREVRRSEDLLSFAVDYLQQRGEKLPGLKTFADIPAFVAALPQGHAAYVLAYVWNRELCFQLHKSCNKAAYLTEDDGGNTRHAIIEEQLP